MADYRFKALNLQENDFVIIELPNNKSVCINRGDIGYSVDFMNENEDIVQCGWVSDDDLEVEDED